MENMMNAETQSPPLISVCVLPKE